MPSLFNYCICKTYRLHCKLIVSVRQQDTEVHIILMIHHRGRYFRLLPFLPLVFLLPGLPAEAADSLSLRLAFPLRGEDGTPNFTGVDRVPGGVLDVASVGDVGIVVPYLASVS